MASSEASPLELGFRVYEGLGFRVCVQGRGDHVQWLLQRKAEILAKEKETLERRLAEALKAAEHTVKSPKP